MSAALLRYVIITVEVDCTPQHYIPDILKALKGNTARFLFKEFPGLKKKLWGGHLWNPSYFVASAGENTEEAANQRRDFQHKLSKRLVDENQVISMEDLRIKNMVKNRKLAKAISDAGWGEFRRMVEYKAGWYGKTVVIIDSFHPSSKLCNKCGAKNAILTLSDREWQCPVCGTIHDRDLNAARNILAEGKRILAG